MNTPNVRIVAGHAFATLSLSCCLFSWTGLILFFLSVKPTLLTNFTGFQMLKLMVVAVVFAIVSKILGSRLWRFALPISAATFLLVWCTMVT